MTTLELIETYFAGLPDPKQAEVRALHDRILGLAPGCELWFEDGLDANGKVLANPSVGYGRYTIRYADGSSRDFYRIGLSANKTGISIYILGLTDKSLLSARFGDRIGKAKVTGYLIRFNKLADIDLAVLSEAIRVGFDSE